MKRKKSEPENNDLIVMALANYICAEAGRNGDLSRQVDTSRIAATMSTTEKDRLAAHKRARKMLAAFI